MPWRAEEMYGNLRRAFEAYARRGAFGRIDIIHFSAWLTHYVSDAHVPFHAVFNYDGQLTGQNGIHARFESFLFERYAKPADDRAEADGADPRTRATSSSTRSCRGRSWCRRSSSPTSTRSARATSTTTRTTRRSSQANRAVMERRLNESIAAVAAMIAGAWEAAGKPPLPLNPPPPLSVADASELALRTAAGPVPRSRERRQRTCPRSRERRTDLSRRSCEARRRWHKPCPCPLRRNAPCSGR